MPVSSAPNSLRREKCPARKPSGSSASNSNAGLETLARFTGSTLAASCRSSLLWQPKVASRGEGRGRGGGGGGRWDWAGPRIGSVRAVLQHQDGGPEGVGGRVQPRAGGRGVRAVGGPERPEPVPTEVQVRVHAAGVNPVDFKTRSG